MTARAISPDCLTDPEAHATGQVDAVWREMREHSPVYLHNPRDLPQFWSITRYDDVRAVYNDPETFSSAHGVLLRPVRYGADPGGGLTLALTDSPRHKQVRSLIAGQFGPRAARATQSSMRKAVRDVLARAIGQGECDFASDIAERLAIFVICHLLGFPEDDHERIFQWTHEAFATGRSLTTQLSLMHYFIDLMDRRRADPSDDVAGLLANGIIDEELLSETEILLNFENLVGAVENAGLSMAAGMLAFLEHPEQWRRLQQDRGLIPSAIEEVLRWTSSATHSMRTATRHCTVRGRQISAGDRVVLWIPSANYDERAFADPGRFDLARRPNRHLALGFGEHVCIGGTMARALMTILLTELLGSAGLIEQVGPAVPVRSIAVRGPAHLPVRIVAR